MERKKEIQDVLPRKRVHRNYWKDLPSQEWFCLIILLTNNVNRVNSRADSTSSRHHVWLYPENQQQKYEEMAQGQLPIDTPGKWNRKKKHIELSTSSVILTKQ